MAKGSRVGSAGSAIPKQTGTSIRNGTATVVKAGKSSTTARSTGGRSN